MPRIDRLGLVIGCIAALGGCDGRADATRASWPRPPPAAVIAPVHSSMPLGDKLARLEAELAAAASSESTEDAAVHVLRAEAITDRLLESEPPFPWLAEAYLLEARLRQLQARADGIVARMRRGERAERVIAEVRAMRRSVATLRRMIDHGAGGVAPVPFETLMASPEAAEVGPGGAADTAG